MNNEIKKIELVQLPIIDHKLKEVGREVSQRIANLDLIKQIATVETVKALKDLRAELNKELADFELQRKFVKEGVNNPYLEFETVYKTEISEKYKDAIDLLKDKIAFVEDRVKSDKKESVKQYFDELCIAEKIDFISFEKTSIEINLSVTEKKYKEQVNEFVLKIVDDLNLIKSTDFEAEILTEYKSSLNVSKAITTVKERKDSEEKENARIKAELIQNRKNALVSLGMKYEEITNCYIYNDDIHISISDINLLTKENFITKFLECEAQIKEVKAKDLLQVEATPNVVIYSKKEIATPLSAPVVEVIKETEPLKKASFEVIGTMTQLRALGEYMKSNNINYKFI